MLKRKHDKIINIMQLRFFCQVALRGSVSRAADDLFRTQSAITRAIRDLEAALNVTLFERHYSGMVPTEYGKCILPRARRAIDDLQAIPALLQKHHTRSSGPLADAGWLFNTRRLAIFIQLYHVNHTQTVAQQLGITQPAVSAALKVLEKGADSALFRRTPEGVRPTPAAELLYPPVSRALNELENIWSDLAARRGVLEGTVRIGALPLSRTRLLPSAIAAFLAQHPGITLMTNESPYESLVADMRAGNIDFIIGALRQDEDLPDLCSEALFEEDMLILLRNNHPLLRHPDPRSQLATAQWVLPRANAPARNLLDKALSPWAAAAPADGRDRGCGDGARITAGLRHAGGGLRQQMRFETDNGLLSVLAGSPARYHPAYRADVSRRQPALPGDAGAVAFYLSAGSGRGRLTFTRHRIGYLLVARLLKRLQRLPAHRGVNMQVGYADHRAHFLQQEEAGAILN